MAESKRKVTYFYDPEVGNFYYGSGHPMKPHRIRMAHNLVLHYGLYKEMTVYRPVRASPEDMGAFHSPEFIRFLQNVTPKNQEQAQYRQQVKEFMLNSDCPIFDKVFEFSQISAGGSIGAAVSLNHGADVSINWAGGLHHAKQAQASGFCYVNDIVLAILELLKYHARVLYIDIDIHHGDGVEEAFLNTPRVMTASFHKFEDKFFPGTGALNSVGVGPGQYYSVNVPLSDGMDDAAYKYLYEPIMDKIRENYRPGAVVLQCGADSLARDKLGMFNLTSEGHASCLRYWLGRGVPLLVLGGGGYRISNVASCWALETGVACGVDGDMDDTIPPSEYAEYYAGNNFRLRVQPEKNLQNCNTPKFLELLRNRVLQHLSHVRPVGTGFHDRVPDMVSHEDLVQTTVRAESTSVANNLGGEAVARWAPTSARA